ncbi:hypothetical protein KKF91_20035 [Myxococcota bacterium]|nr:hypothetical protein [Myxococcota bacterium]MBU1432836.1 hypothetical protein [Myxococcota bacterium]MBU1898398.1 hypothetical protein [Myxococcota bacterium]
MIKHLFTQSQAIFNDELAYWKAQAEQQRAAAAQRMTQQRAQLMTAMDEAIQAQRAQINEVQAHFSHLAERQWKLYQDLFSVKVP